MSGRATPTLGETLAALRARSGLSLDQVAKMGGWTGPSSVQRYFEADYDAKPMHVRVAAKFSAALTGRGEPPIAHEEITALAEVPRPTDEDDVPARDATKPRHLIDVTDLPIDARRAIETLVGRLRAAG